MSEDQSQEKTEQATPKREQDSKKKGQSIKSRDFNTTVILLVGGFGLLVYGPIMLHDVAVSIKVLFQFNSSTFATPEAWLSFVFSAVKSVVMVVMPFLVLMVFAAFLGPLLLGSFSVNVSLLAPKLERLSVAKGLKRMFSVKSLMELFKAIGKFLIIFSVGLSVFMMYSSDIYQLSSYAVEDSTAFGLRMLINCFLIVSAGLIIISLIDVPFQIMQHLKTIKMTKQEVRDEMKDTEGKPEVKGRIRSMQQELSRGRMMDAVPDADVIVTNPTHYAVALKYDVEGVQAPIVLAKGRDLIAFEIMKLAKSCTVPVLSTPPLARALYFSTKLNQEIPQGLYVAVAQVLAYVFQLQRYSKPVETNPDILDDLPIPSDLRRDE